METYDSDKLIKQAQMAVAVVKYKIWQKYLQFKIINGQMKFNDNQKLNESLLV